MVPGTDLRNAGWDRQERAAVWAGVSASSWLPCLVRRLKQAGGGAEKEIELVDLNTPPP